ncbi:hypothetical protein N0V85_004240 [Neurospora sp. IMI 360204]|nr:hypothetical protein N0V85_004240 [Neurospora sp. IMI 360204]
MPNPQTYGARGSWKRDFQLCKTVFVAATFEEAMASRSGIPTFDGEILREQSTTVFLHQDVDYSLTRFLDILTNDIFPVLETEHLVKFRISFLRSTTWDEDCLIEFYTLSFKYHPDGKCGIDIWRAGIGEYHISDSNFKLWNLGDYLSRIPSLDGPLYWAMAFHANELPDIPTIGVWKFDRTEFDEANLKLQQKEGYRYDLIAKLDSEPRVTWQSHSKGYSKEGNPAKRKEAELESETGDKDGTKASLDTEAGPNPKTSQHSKEKAKTSLGPETWTVANVVQQIYEDVTSNLPETQEVVRESQTQQSQLSRTRSSKRLTANDGGPVGGNVSNTRAKRAKAAHPPPPARMPSTPDAQAVSDFLESIDENHLLDSSPDAQRGPPSFTVTPAFLRPDPAPEEMENATPGDEHIGDSLVDDPNNRYPPTDMSFDFQPLQTSQTEKMFPGILDSEDEDSPIVRLISRRQSGLA